MKVRRVHAFEGLTPKEAVALQRRLAGRVRRSGPLPRRLTRVAGVDCSIARDGRLHACIVLCDAPDWRVVESHDAAGDPPMPYVPGLLSFREIPILLDTLRRLRGRPQVILVDGQGVAHPRGLGLAAHLGLFLDVPTIGVAKSRLCGEHADPGPERGDEAPLRLEGRRIGSVLRTRARVKPLYISVGNRVGLRPAVRAVLACTPRYRLPEPIRHADRMSRAHARAVS
jgi:deoxyribonuclease V